MSVFLFSSSVKMEHYCFQIASLVSCTVVLMVIMFLGPLFYHLPFVSAFLLYTRERERCARTDIVMFSVDCILCCWVVVGDGGNSAFCLSYGYNVLIQNDSFQTITDYNIIQNALNNFNIHLSEILAFDCLGITH